ncbi:hypothetical protein HHX47_DHR3000609 [Lentinula edodes]|nr:hypothetical protein HHX47_DHR3000609 [Lentinula edodes]
MTMSPHSPIYKTRLLRVCQRRSEDSPPRVLLTIKEGQVVVIVTAMRALPEVLFEAAQLPPPAAFNRALTRSLPQFSPLPSVILRTLSEKQEAEMPDREAFNKSIKVFLKTLMPEMQESASLSPATYAGVAKYLVTGEIPPHASPYLQTWMTTHRLLPGSQTHPLILIPRDPIPENLAISLQEYQADPVRYTHGDGTTLPEQSIFDRLPVQDELYDILAYAHRAHKNSNIMTDEAHITWPMADIFVRLCPVCAPRDSDPGESLENDD